MSIIILVLITAYLGMCTGMYFLQSRFIYFPTILQNPGVQRFDLVRPDAVLQIVTHTHDGTKAVIYFGGNAEDVSLSLPDYVAAFPQTAIYMLCYRGYGGSTGSVSEKTMHTDAQALYDKVSNLHSEVTVIGRSIGTGVAIRLAANNLVSRLILITPFDSLVSLAQRSFPYLPVGWLLKERYESYRVAPKIRVPTLILVAADDEIIAARQVQRLVDSFTEVTPAVKVIENAGHNSISAYPEFWRTIFQFVELP
ncbi:MAG TPA: hypothetical protein PKD64_07625 [Pirellulaceae bacterium]|nr:hypothetical protein [Pirellulaceae bacterium]HMO92056.1 hypothetical protein [Pirellulaceae bacterium]HMP69932.1 hypothetical protein [Pirellulaceae bacterium]